MINFIKDFFGATAFLVMLYAILVGGTIIEGLVQ